MEVFTELYDNEYLNQFNDSLKYEDFFTEDLYSQNNVFQKIFNFISYELLDKYNLKSCVMFESDEKNIDVEYYFKVSENITPKDLSNLSLEINREIYQFCVDNYFLSSFFRTLLILDR